MNLLRRAASSSMTIFTIRKENEEELDERRMLKIGGKNWRKIENFLYCVILYTHTHTLESKKVQLSFFLETLRKL